MMKFIFTAARVTDSQAIDTAYFNADTQQLAVVFWSGSVVIYSNFSNGEWDSFNKSLSKGRYYNQYIKGNRAFPSQLAENVTFENKQDVQQIAEDSVSVAEPVYNVTVNIYVNGDPEAIAKAVESLAPSFRAIKEKR
jgi:hypothetical protein